MKFFIGVTDNQWYRFLSARNADEVNFWRPRSTNTFRAIPSGSIFLFKLHAPINKIVGGGVFVKHTTLPLSMAWKVFEEKNGAEWMGNDMQKDAFHTLYALEEKVHSCNNAAFKRDWLYLQSSDHFYYMCTKFFSEGNNNKSINPYNTPFDAYINYMNVLSDFSQRLEIHLEKQILSVSGGMPNKETG